MNIESIPPIKNFPQIYDAFKNKKLVVFVGAGISSLWGCARWEDLSNQIIDDLFEEDKFDYRTAELLNIREGGSVTDSINRSISSRKACSLPVSPGTGAGCEGTSETEMVNPYW